MFPTRGTTSQSGSFVHTSPLASSSHDPLISLASHCVLSAFGPTVQLVADALQSRGPVTYQQLISYIQGQHNNDVSGESIRASLLVLMQHSIVTAKQQHATRYLYCYNLSAAIHILRYAKYIEYIKKTVSQESADLVETLLLAGRLRTVDVVSTAATSSDSDQEGDEDTRQTLLEAFSRLVNAGFIQRVLPLQEKDIDEEEECEFEGQPPTKRAKLEETPEQQPADDIDDDAAVVQLLKSQPQYQAILPIDAVWRVNLSALDDSLRAFHLGRLVADLLNHRIPSAGSMVTAALRFRAHQQHAVKNNAAAAAAQTSFVPRDVVKYLPKAVQQRLEEKVGGVHANVSKAFQELSEARNPVVVRRIGEGRYEIAVSCLVEFLCERIVHQVVHDRHDEVAARIVSILSRQGWLESDTLAEHAMIPAKDTREILHQLYRSQYVELFQLSSSRQHNPANAIYLWSVHKERLSQRVTENVATALWNIRLRNQHQVMQVGREWMDRAARSDTDENVHETDKLNYQKFCLGLARLDCAALQLDETLMALTDF